ncbi:MAG: MFS transporter [Actinophytocola sp.]|nr:MFS transporter [Actinophytocola sp.]
MGCGHRAGTREFRRISAALLFAGAGTFVLLYAVQGLLPSFARTYGVSPTVSSLTLSLATGALALAILPVSALAESRARKRVLSLSLSAAAVLGLLAPLAPTFGVLLGIRTLQGLAMAGVPALAMAHLSQEVHPRSLGRAMGLFIAGNTAGGLSGRVIATAVADVAGWRVALAVVGLVSLGCLVLFRVLVPEPLREPPAARPCRVLLGQLRGHLADRAVRRVCLVSFLLMAAFVSVYNYLGFRLMAEPFGLPQAVVGLVFLAYLAGTASSTTAGALGDRFGRLPVLAAGIGLTLIGAVLSLPSSLPLVLGALVVITVGFFAAHSSASSWLGHRVTTAPAQASALYLFCYYAGSSVGGTTGGLAFEVARWPGLVGFVVALQVTALAATGLLWRSVRRKGRQPAPHGRSTTGNPLT